MSASPPHSAPLSSCCRAPVTTECGEDFGERDDVRTCFWQCSRCQKPCNASAGESVFHSSQGRMLPTKCHCIDPLWEYHCGKCHLPILNEQENTSATTGRPRRESPTSKNTELPTHTKQNCPLHEKSELESSRNNASPIIPKEKTSANAVEKTPMNSSPLITSMEEDRNIERNTEKETPASTIISSEMRSPSDTESSASTATYQGDSMDIVHTKEGKALPSPAVQTLLSKEITERVQQLLKLCDCIDCGLEYYVDGKSYSVKPILLAFVELEK